MHNYKAIISYDGSQFSGWQKGRNVRTVEGILQPLIEKKLNHPVVLQAASRTDAGVHARGQVINFYTPQLLDGEKFCLSMNKLLPDDIRFQGATEVDLTFHPTLDVIEKEYRYNIQTGIYQNPLIRHFAWHVYYPIDWDSLLKGASYFIGTHDFLSLCNIPLSGGPIQHNSTIRTIHSIVIKPQKTHYEICIKGDNFLYKMVRNLVGTLVDVGMGKRDPNSIPALLESKNRTLAGVSAPAHGLTLYQVNYPEQKMISE